MAPSPVQLLIVALIILLLFGATRLSEIGKGLGEGIRNFKKGLQDDEPGADEVADAKGKTKKRLPPREKDGADAVEDSEKAKEKKA
jgi:sec-independent protein translocase protein TatA